MNTFRRRAWREAEVSLLREWFPLLGPKACMPILPGRGLNAIKGKAGDLGLVWRKDAKLTGAQRFATETGYPVPAPAPLTEQLLDLKLRNFRAASAGQLTWRV